MNRSLLLLLLLIIPSRLAGQRVHPPPEMPRWLERACQGEDCGFGYRAVACHRLELRAADSLAARVMGRIEPGDTVTAEIGNLRVTAPGIVVLIRDTVLASDDSEPRTDTLRLVRGDTLYVLEYRQLGAWTWWYRGRLTEGIEFWNGPAQRYFGRGRDSLAGLSTVEPVVETWLRITGPRGRIGWWLWSGEDWARLDWGETCQRG